MTASSDSLVGLIGWPVAHSISPQIHDAAFKALGLPWRYVLLPTAPDGLRRAVRRLKSDRFQGANVTVPHKEQALQYLDQVGPTAREIGAVNTIGVEGERLIGHNTDAAGFLGALQDARFEPGGRRALVLGAGGAARAVVYALARAGCAVTIHNRTSWRATRLARAIGASQTNKAGGDIEAVPALEHLDLGQYDLLVNTTSVGMGALADSSPWPDSLPMPSHWMVFDLVYRPTATRLLARARAAGAVAIDGLGMLVHQAALSFALWTGRTPPLSVMRRAADEALVSHEG